MAIDNSLEWRYWPRGDERLLVGMRQRVYHYWDATYKDLVAEWTPEGVGGNANWNLTNTYIELLYGEAGEIVKLPVGFLDPTDPLITGIWDVTPITNYRVPVGELPPNPNYEISASIEGLLVWQAYHLMLCLQVNKLTVFGRRGR